MTCLRMFSSLLQQRNDKEKVNTCSCKLHVIGRWQSMQQQKNKGNIPFTYLRCRRGGIFFKCLIGNDKFCVISDTFYCIHCETW